MVRDSVLLLRRAGFKTFTSCEGGRGHAFRHETIGLEVAGGIAAFQRRLVAFLRSHGMRCFTVNLVTDYHPNHPQGKRWVYLEGQDLLSEEKRRRVVEAINRKERMLRRQLRSLLSAHELVKYNRREEAEKAGKRPCGKCRQ